jgi:hypothetical protein
MSLQGWALQVCCLCRGLFCAAEFEFSRCLHLLLVHMVVP